MRFPLQACLAEGKFFVCDQISPIPDGKLLLNYIRNVSFTSKITLIRVLIQLSYFIHETVPDSELAHPFLVVQIKLESLIKFGLIPCLNSL